MTDPGCMVQENESTLAQTKREMDQLGAALAAGGVGSVGNLECRLAALQERFLSTPALDLAGIESRLEVIRDLVATLGSRGYLLHLVEATLADLRQLRGRAGDR